MANALPNALEAGEILAVRLTDRQAALNYELSRRSEALAKMYIGALTVIKDIDNPDRLSQAANSIRELMEKLPQIVSVSMPQKDASLQTKVNELQDSWASALRSACKGSGGAAGWLGMIDPALRKFLVKAEDFFNWFGVSRVRRKEQFKKFLRETDGAGRIMPSAIEKSNIDAWSRMSDYFIGITHHNPNVVYGEFVDRLSELEEFLLKVLHPEPIADFNEIDKLIAEGEET